MAANGIVTSLVSIFTSTELINMSSSEDSENELIDNNNHIITSLQSHENNINRNEESQLLERREQENEGPTKHHRQPCERKYETKAGEESLERSLHLKGSGKFGQNSIFQTIFTKN